MGYSGEGCECDDDLKKCMETNSNKICSGHGNCVCGKCQCKMDEKKYSGKYCEECLTCPAHRWVQFELWSKWDLFWNGYF